MSDSLWFDSNLVARWLPVGKVGEWEVRRNIVEGDRDVWLQNHGARGGLTPPGTYTELYNGTELWMYDVPSEQMTAEGFVEAAKGRILITGLGLGMVPAMLIKKESVKSIEIVERQDEVIELGWPHLKRLSDKIKLHHSDAFAFIPKGRFDIAWHDIIQPHEIDRGIGALLAHYAPY